MSILAVIFCVFIFVKRGISDFIIYSMEDGIYHYDLKEGGLHSKVYTLHNGGYLNLEFEYKYNCIIFENANAKLLQRLCLSGEKNTVETITKYTGYDWVNAIAYDWIGENIYWVTRNFSQIVMARRNDSNQRVLFNRSHLDFPVGLALDPHRRWMYWTDTSTSNPRIVRAQMDGNQSTYQVLVEAKNNVNGFFFITLDHQFENMYWTDVGLNRVMKASLTGENLEIIASGENISKPVGISMHKTILYWADRNKSAIFYTDVHSDRRGVFMLVGNIPGLWDLKVVSRQTQTIDTGFSDWSTWGSCSKTCGSGKKTRTRSCDNPFPSNGGAACCGDSLQEYFCNTQACPVNGRFSTWSIWSSCSKTCGLGTRTRSRVCNNPVPSIGGATCSGDTSTEVTCNIQACPAETKNDGIIIGMAIGAGSCIAVFIIIIFVFCLAKKRKWIGICCTTVQQENENQYEAATFSSENQHVYMEFKRPQ